MQEFFLRVGRKDAGTSHRGHEGLRSNQPHATALHVFFQKLNRRGCTWNNRACRLLMLILLLIPARVMCHGTLGKKIQGGTGIQAFYSDRSPMSYCRIKVFRDRESVPFQAGATDRHGRFMIWPEKGHSYKFVVADGMGHRYEANIEIPAPSRTAPNASADAGRREEHNAEKGPGRCILFKASVGILGIFLAGCLARRYTEIRNRQSS